jgi:hypothetical protein
MPSLSGGPEVEGQEKPGSPQSIPQKDSTEGGIFRSLALSDEVESEQIAIEGKRPLRIGRDKGNMMETGRDRLGHGRDPHSQIERIPVTLSIAPRTAEVPLARTLTLQEG